MSQNFVYPSSSQVTAVIPAVSNNNSPIPSESILIGGENPSGNLKPIQTDAAGNLNVNISSSVLPSGGATAANQVLEIADLAALNARIAGSLTPVAFNEVVNTYVGATTVIDTVTYKLGGVTKMTLTLTYDGSNRLINVLAT